MSQISAEKAVEEIQKLLENATTILIQLREQKEYISQFDKEILDKCLIIEPKTFNRLTDDEKTIIQDILWKHKKFTSFTKDISNIYKKSSDLYEKITIALKLIKFISKDKPNIDSSTFQSQITQYINSLNKEVIADIRNKFLPTLRNRCSRINILGTSINTRRSHKIGDFFVDLSLKHNDDVIKFSKLEDEIKETLEGSSDLKILIQGKQGFGKSTLLKQIAIKFAEDEFEHTCVPIFISLKRFSESKDFPDLFEFLVRIFSNENVSLEQLREVLVKGKALLLLDGLDTNSGIHATVSEFIEKFSSNKFVITCNKEESHLSDFKTYKLQGFEPGDINEFVKKWFSPKSETLPQEAQDLIKDIKNNTIKDFASSPLLLQFLCLIYQKDHHLIKHLGRMCLYKEAMFALIDDLDEESGFYPQDEIYRNISLLEKVNLISYLAIKTLETGLDYIPVGKLSEYAAEFIRHKSSEADTSRHATAVTLA